MEDTEGISVIIFKVDVQSTLMLSC